MVHLNIEISETAARRLEELAKARGYASVSSLASEWAESQEGVSSDLEKTLLDRLDDPEPSIDYTPGLIQQWGREWAGDLPLLLRKPI